jgi:hypothetical protein
MADESYWSYRASSPTPEYSEVPEGAFKGSEKEWYALSPGMRREIVRSFNRRSKNAAPS